MAEKKVANPGALAGEQLISLAEPFGGWVSPISNVNSVPHFQASIEGVEAPTFAKQNSNQYAESSGITLFQIEKLGHIAPAPAFVPIADTSSYITDLPLNGSETSTSFYGIVVLKNGRIVQIDPAGMTTLAKLDPTAHTPVSSANGDMMIFRDYTTTPTEWVVWSYDYSGGSDIDIAHSSNLSSQTSGWYSAISGATPLHVGVPHKGWTGPDGNIYFTDGAFIQQIVVAATASLASATIGNRLPLGSGWTATGGCSYKNYSAIIASDKNSSTAIRGSTKVFLWDGMTSTVNGVVSTAPNFIYDVPDNFGNGIFFDGETLYAITNGRNSSTKIFEFTSKGFRKVFETPFIIPSNPSMQGCVESFQDGLMIGAVKPGEGYAHIFRFYGSGFHDEGYLCDSDTTSGHNATQIGMVKNLLNFQLYVGVGYPTNNYRIFVQSATLYQSQGTTSALPIQMRSILYTSGILGRRMYPMGFNMTLSRIKLFVSQWGTGASLYLSMFEGYNSFSPGSATDRLNILLDTNSAIPNGYISGTNPGGGSIGYIHQCVPVGTQEIDLSNISVVNISSFYINIRWTHTSTSAIPAFIRRMEMHVAQSQ